jgi:hypothetical protein
MAQTKKKRRRKRRGTQSGRVDTRRGPRPRNRQEAQARARSRSKGKGGGGQRAHRHDQPPTWRGALVRGAVASGLFFALVVFLFQRPVGAAAALSLVMLAFYVPMGYYIDRFFYDRRQRAQQKEREEAKGG